MKESTTISERLIELMQDKGINAKDLSVEIGVAKSTVSYWLHGMMSMTLSTALKVANYFNCSLDFLTGRSETVIDFVPKTCPPFYSQLVKVLNKSGKRKSEIYRDTRIKSSHMVDWSRGSDPHITLLVELANYLDITLDELVGRDR